MLCLPTADQPALATQVQALGAGLALDGDTATPSEIKAAADQLLADPSYAANARRLAAVIFNSPGVPAAVRQLEQLASAACHSVVL
jgi:UDP:flavonoid glycosyltransferase YjiC (YdhE family)